MVMMMLLWLVRMMIGEGDADDVDERVMINVDFVSERWGSIGTARTVIKQHHTIASLYPDIFRQSMG